MAFNVYIQEKKEARLSVEKKIQNGHQNGSQNQFFDNILLGTNLREKYLEYKNEQQEKCFKCEYRTPAMLHRFSTKGNFM